MVNYENMSEDELKSMLKATITENSRLNNKQSTNNDEADRLSLSQRFSQEELRGSNERLKKAEAILQRGGYSSTPEKSVNATGIKWQGKEAIIAKQQISELEDWANNNNILFPELALTVRMCKSVFFEG